VSSEVPLLLVDGHNLLWRAWFGFPARIRSRDKTRDLTGVFGFFALLRVATRELLAPPEIVVVFDGENAWSDRSAIDPAYKAHRRTDEDAMAPIRALCDVIRGLDAIGLHHVCIDTAEADDVIASAVQRCRAQAPERPVWIMSTDRDFYQLVDERTRILNTARRPGQRVIDGAAIRARFGVSPAQWCDRASLVGDPADGIRGVHGVGAVTAARLLAGGLSVEQLWTSGRLVGHLGNRVREARGDIERWKRMIRTRPDLPLPPRLLSGAASLPLPSAPVIMEMLDLW
jgi:DNA polymerase-1